MASGATSLVQVLTIIIGSMIFLAVCGSKNGAQTSHIVPLDWTGLGRVKLDTHDCRRKLISPPYNALKKS